MRKNKQTEESLEQDKRNYIMEIDEIDRRLKDWKFSDDFNPAVLPTNLKL